MGSHVLQHPDLGNGRRSAASSPGGLGSRHRRAPHNPGRGGRPLPSGLPRRPPHGSAGGGGRKMAAASAGRRAPGEGSLPARHGPDPGRRRQFRPPPVCGGPRPLPRPPRVTRAAPDARWRRMNTSRGFREPPPPPPSLKSSRGRSRGVDGRRALGGARERGAAGASTGSALPAGAAAGRDGGRFRADGRGLRARPPGSGSAGRTLRLVLEAAPLQREMAPPSPAPALYI